MVGASGTAADRNVRTSVYCFMGGEGGTRACALLAAHRLNCIHTRYSTNNRWAEAPIKIARMTLTIKLDGNWSSFQLANSAPPLSVTDSAIAPSARIPLSSRNDTRNVVRHVNLVLHAPVPGKALEPICSCWMGGYCWQPLASRLPQEKFCYGRLHRRLLRRYRPQSAVNCSTL